MTTLSYANTLTYAGLGSPQLLSGLFILFILPTLVMIAEGRRE